MPTPLHAQIADQLTRRIVSGHYPVGSTLPAEPLLAAELQVSRSTLRAALASLERRRLVSRRKNAGTRVESSVPQGEFGANLSSLPALIQWAQQCERVVQKSTKVVLDLPTAKFLGLAPGSVWLLVHTLRLDGTAKHRAISATQAYIDARYANILSQIRKYPSMLMSELLERETGVDLSTVEQEVFACTIEAEQAVALAASKGEAALKVLRRYRPPAGAPVLVTVSIHPASRFSLKMTLTRQVPKKA